VDMYGIHFLVFQKLIIILISLFNTECIPNALQTFRISLANGIHMSMRMPLINRDELSTKSQSDNRYINFVFIHNLFCISVFQTDGIAAFFTYGIYKLVKTHSFVGPKIGIFNVNKTPIR